MKVIKKITCFIVSGMVALTFFSCSGDSDSLSENNFQRSLDVSSKNVTALEVSTYFSQYRYGPTQVFYHFKDENTVLRIFVENDSADFDVVITVNIFDENDDEKLIAGWINNRVSDGLVNAAKPKEVWVLAEDKYSVISSEIVDHSVACYGDEYDNYWIKLYIDSSSEEPIYTLKSFVVETEIHIRTKDLLDDWWTLQSCVGA